MARAASRRSLVAAGVIASVVIHALILAGLHLLPEPEDEEPECPTRREVCQARCLFERELVIPPACPAPSPCECELVEVEPVPEIVALPTPAVPELVVPPPPPPPPPPPKAPVPEPPPETKAAVEKRPAKDRAAKKAPRKRAQEAAESVAIARVLGTQGSSELGTIFDVIESEDNNLGELFASGMTTTVAADGRIAELAGGAVHTDLEESLAEAVRRKLPSLRKCHTKSTVDAGIEGKLDVTLNVDDAGKPTGVQVDRDTTGSAEIQRCVVDRIKRWRLPSGQAGETSFKVVFAIAD